MFRAISPGISPISWYQRSVRVARSTVRSSAVSKSAITVATWAPFSPAPACWLKRVWMFCTSACWSGWSGVFLVEPEHGRSDAFGNGPGLVQGGALGHQYPGFEYIAVDFRHGFHAHMAAGHQPH